MRYKTQSAERGLFAGDIDFYGKSGFDYAGSFGIRYHELPEGEDASFFLCRELAESDRLFVCLWQINGTVDVTVGMEGKAPIYEGRGLEDISFVLNISEPGTYRITVSGHDACGSIEFTKQAAEG